MAAMSTSNESPGAESHLDVVVIGAGWAGLAAAKTFLQVQPEAQLLVIDGNETVGGTWARERLYPGLRCEAGWGLFQFSDLPMERKGYESEGEYIPGAAVHEYLDAYAKKFDLHGRMLLGTKVLKCWRDEQGAKWCLSISTDSSSARTLRCHKVIVASGLTSEPFVPAIASDEFGGPVYHSKDLGRVPVQDAVAGPMVHTATVYGGSKSAFEAVYYLARAGKQVQWIVRPDGGGPSLMTPLKMLGVIPSMTLNNTRFFGVFSPNAFDQSSKWYRFFHGPSKVPLADRIVTTFWQLSTWMMALPARYGHSSNGQKLRPKHGLQSSFWSPATLGVMTCPGFWELVHNSGLVTVYRRSVKSLTKHAVELDDGTRLNSDAFIFATGWQVNHTIFSDEECGDLGLPVPSSTKLQDHQKWHSLRSQADASIIQRLPLLSKSPEGYLNSEVEADYHLYRFLIPTSSKYADRSIAFIGFLRNTNTGMPIVLEAQALWITAYLLGHLDIPKQESRELEAAETNAWIRRRYVCGRKVPFALGDWFPYIDMLYGDLGVVSHRKSNWFSEVFGFYRPEEFRGVVSEWMEKKDRPKTGSCLYMGLLMCVMFCVGVSLLWTYLPLIV